MFLSSTDVLRMPCFWQEEEAELGNLWLLYGFQMTMRRDSDEQSDGCQAASQKDGETEDAGSLTESAEAVGRKSSIARDWIWVRRPKEEVVANHM